MARIFDIGSARIIESVGDCFKCKNGSRTTQLIRMKNLRTQQVEQFLTQSCECQRQEIEDIQGGVFWEPAMILTIVDGLDKGMTNKELSEYVVKKHPGSANLNAGASREGKYEWRSSTTKKLENMRSAKIPLAWSSVFEQQSIGDELVKRICFSTFKDRLDKNPKTWVGFGRGTEQQIESGKKLTEYDSTLCLCGHELGAHDDGRCTVCKTWCKND